MKRKHGQRKQQRITLMYSQFVLPISRYGWRRAKFGQSFWLARAICKAVVGHPTPL